jgi:hypothetical protein
MIPNVTGLRGFLRATVRLFLLHQGPWLVELNGSWPQIMNLLMVEALSMSTTGLESSGDRGLGRCRQSRSGADPAPFVEMVNNRLSLGFTYLGVEQGRMASLREFFLATAAAQQTNAILTIDLANHEIALSWASSILAFGIDTG